MTRLRWLLGLALAMATSLAAAQGLLQLTQAEAVRGDWHDIAPPQAGWEPVQVPHAWQQRWPHHDGVVWYRLQWEQQDGQPVGLFLNYLIMGGAVSLNGALLHEDPSLAPPVTRAWNQPRYWLVSPPLLRRGTNTLLLRVSGGAAHQSGIGPVVVGPPALVEPLFRRESLLRHDLQLVSLSVAGTIALFFGVLWLLRRKARVYGWFAFMQSCWVLVGLNQIVTSPWPFATNDGWHALNSIAILLFAAAMTTFLLRFRSRRMPRTERAVWGFALAASAWMAVAPPDLLYPSRSLLMLASVALVWGNCVAFAVAGWRSGQPDQRILAICTTFMIGFSGHDLLVFLQVIRSNMYYASMATHIMMLGMALVLAWRFAQSLRRIEHFNVELQASVDSAKSELAATLQRQHELEVSHARLAERVNLARDLHDGLGGALVGSIAALEHEPDKATPPMLLAVLKGLRDDLRLIVDSAAHQGGGEHGLADLLAPLRRRFAELLEAGGVESRWNVSGLEGVRLPRSAGLDLMRLLQEALTNVIKHSGATRVQVTVAHAHGRLQVQVEDDGVGLPQPLPAGAGIGLRSMGARAERLGGELRFESSGVGTRVLLQAPLAATQARPARARVSVPAAPG